MKRHKERTITFRSALDLNKYIHKVFYKDGVKNAFAELRKKGYFARMNFSCCQSCAGAEMPENTEKYVFWHRQANENLEKSGSVNLYWSGSGSEICEVLEKYGCKVNWNGSDSRSIEIELPWQKFYAEGFYYSNLGYYKDYITFRADLMEASDWDVISTAMHKRKSNGTLQYSDDIYPEEYKIAREMRQSRLEEY